MSLNWHIQRYSLFVLRLMPCQLRGMFKSIRYSTLWYFYGPRWCELHRVWKDVSISRTVTTRAKARSHLVTYVWRCGTRWNIIKCSFWLFWLVMGFWWESGQIKKKSQVRMIRVAFQVVVPEVYRSHISYLAHYHCLSGHLGIRKKLDCVLRHFFLAWGKIRYGSVL